LLIKEIAKFLDNSLRFQSKRNHLIFQKVETMKKLLLVSSILTLISLYLSCCSPQMLLFHTQLAT